MKTVQTLYDINSPILLHTCCAPCGAPSLERLLENSAEVTIFYANSNIFPYEEYLKRLEYVEKIGQYYSVQVIAEAWDHDSWLDAVKGLEDEPEKGLRCRACFHFNLTRTMLKAKELNIPQFTTTLSVSPHKDSLTIFEEGDAFTGFIRENFKKKDGFKRSLELSIELGLYRQDYCGCEFSLR